MTSIKGIDGFDLVGLVGVAAVLYGVSQWSPPGAVILGGLAALAFGIAGPRLRRKGRTS